MDSILVIIGRMASSVKFGIECVIFLFFLLLRLPPVALSALALRLDGFTECHFHTVRLCAAGCAASLVDVALHNGCQLFEDFGIRGGDVRCFTEIRLEVVEFPRTSILENQFPWSLADS